MTRIDELPADRKAVLQLLLKQGKTYDELASLLRIDADKVRERARDALDQLGPSDGAGLALERQDELSDYLLGQLSTTESDATRALLEESAAARAWARVVSGELREIAGDDLPDIPADRPDRPQAPERPQRAERGERRAPQRPFDLSPRRGGLHQRPSSRLGGLLLLAAVGAVIALFIILVVSNGDDEGDTGSPAATQQRTQTSSGQPQVLGQINLNPPAGSDSKALAALTLVRQGDETDILFQGQGMPPNKTGDVYALWVTAKSGGVARLGFMPRVGKTGKVRFPGALPSNVDLSKYDTLLVTRETTASPSQPGTVLLRGDLPGA